jgi:type II secretory pathway component GspD/PulD (secretin)/beta-lactamase regulating signal transducer with metallopeptidase domain
MPVLETLFSQETIVRLGWMLVHFLWQAAAVALLLAVLLRLLRRTGANVRYAAACGALALMVLLPLITMQLVEAPGPVAEAAPPLELLLPPAAEPLPLVVQTVDELPPVASTPLEVVNLAVPVPWQERAIAALEGALPYLVLGWLAGVFGLSAWHLGGWTQLHRLKHRMARQAAATMRATLDELATKLGVRRAVTLLESAIVEVPTVLGWLQPVILLPAGALTGLNPDQLKAILAHELAHIRRWDYLANIIQTVVEILGFFHPAVWWVSSRIRIERENCCDDLAVQVCGSSLQYAKALTSMEEIRHSRTDLALAASGGSLMARIARLLGRPVVDDRRFAWLPGLIALLLVVGVIIPAALVLGAPDTPPATRSVDSEPNNPTQAGEEQQNPAQVLIKFSLFPKVSSGKIVDRETRNMLAGILAAEDLQALRETVHADAKRDMTLGEVLRTWVANRPMTPENIGVLIDVLQSRGYLEGEATPEVLATNNQEARMVLGSEEVIRPPTDPTSPPQTVKLGAFVQMTPHIPSLASDRILLEIAAQWRERVDPNDPSDAPDIRRTELATAITLPTGKVAALVTETTAGHDDSLRMLLVGPATIVQAQPAEGQAPSAAVTTIVGSLPQGGTPQSNEVRVATDWVLAKARTKTVLDRETLRLIGGVLAADRPQAAQELADDLQKETTLGDVLKKYVARQSLSQKTGQALIDLLKTRGLVRIQSNNPLIAIAAEGRPFELRNISEEWFAMPPSQNPGAGEEPKPTKFEYGTIVKGTAGVEDDNSVTLEMAVALTEPEPRADPNALPVIRTMATSTTVNVPENRYFSLLVESTDRKAPQAQGAESLLVMVKPSITRPARQPEISETRYLRLNHQTAQRAKDLLPSEHQKYVQVETSGASNPNDSGYIVTITAPTPIADAIQQMIRKLDRLPRQVLLDTRVVEIERGNLLNLGVAWSFPTIQAQGSDDGGDWTKALSIGYSADSTFTKSLLTTLNLLGQANQAEIVSNPQIVTLDGRAAQLRSVQQVWFMMSDPSAASGSRSELRTIESGTILGITPRVGDSNEITLEMSVEVSDTLPGNADRPPIIARRQVKNAITIMNGGTVAVAGLRSERSNQTREIAIFITATLVPEVSGVAPSYVSRGETAPPASPPSGVSTQQVMDARHSYVDLDSLVQEWARNIVATEKEIRDLRQTHLPSHPALRQKQDALDDLYRRLEERRKTLREELDGGAGAVRLINPTDPQKMSATFAKSDLFDVLRQISRRLGVDIAVDLSVKTHRITADLVDTSAETAIRRVLQGTPYAFKRMSGDNRPTYLVYHPITVESEGGELVQALDKIAAMAETPIIPAPSVQGKVTIRLENANLETALSIVLAGTPFVFKNMGSYYIVGDRRSRELPFATPADAGTQIHLTATFTKIPGNRTLDRDTAAAVFNLIAPGGDAKLPMGLDELRGAGVDNILKTLAGQAPGKRFQNVIELLESKGFLDRLAEPQLCILAGKQARLSSGVFTLDVRHEVLEAGQTLQLDIEASMEMGASTPPLKSFGTLEVPNDRHGLLSLGCVRHSAGQTDQAGAETYFLIVHPILLASGI